MKRIIYIISFLLLIFLPTLGLLLKFPEQSAASDSIGAWQNTISLPYQIASHVAFSYENKMFVIGGANTVVVPKTSYTSISNENSLSTWTVSSVLPPLIFWHALSIKENHIYILGGATHPPVTQINSVYLGNINSNEIASWNALTPMPKKLARGASVIVGNKLYYAGGVDNIGFINQNVYFTTINSDGTIGNWNTAGQLPTPMEGFGMVEVNGSIVVIGGKSSSLYLSSVKKATLNSNGTIQSWISLPSLPTPAYRSGITKAGNLLISAGGINGNTNLSAVYYSRINADGTIGNWMTSASSLPNKNCCGSLVTAGDYIYLIGGHDQTNYLSTVYRAKVTPASSTALDVPLLKQTSEPWQSNEYDSALVWNPDNPTINRWGCAMTSAAMILQYHGITKLPNNTTLDPGTLNTWLKNQSDGYIGSGNINWLAISRLSKLAKDSGNNPEFPYHALEFRRADIDVNLLTNDLTSSQPVILEEPGHFIVATGVNGSTFDINDSFYNRSLLTDGYNNTFLSMRRYIPSHTDLSYLMFISNPEVTVTAYNNQGAIVSESYIENPIVDPTDGIESGDPVQITLVTQPPTDRYTLNVFANTEGTFQLSAFLYDKEGNYEISTKQLLLSDQYDEVILDFHNNDITQVTLEKTITFDSTIQDINESNIQGISKAIHAQVQLAKNNYEKGNIISAQHEIEVAIRLLQIQEQRIQTSVYEILMDDLLFLQSSV